MTQPPQYAPQYFVKDSCLYETGANKQGAFTRKLCNLAPAVLCEITKDDGVSSTRYVCLGGVHQSGRTLPEITIPAEEVEGLGWIVKYWGMDCILEPGLKTKSSVWNALQTTALNVEKITIFSTTGWKQIDGEWCFLMPGDDRFTVELPGKMHGYGMERKCDPFDIQTAACMLRMMPVPEEVMFPLLAFTFLSPLNHFLKEAGCEPKFVMLLSGKTGSRKSTLAALMLSFFGKFTASELPLSFRDTANSILLNTFYLKDVLTVIDDLHPSSRQEEQKMNGTAQAIMRAYGDRTGKGRLRADATPMESRPPQGNAIVTAEFTPDIGESGTARYFALELKESDVDLQNLSAYQKEAAKGTLQRCMYAYTQWIKETFLCSEEAKQEFVQFLNFRFLFCRDEFRKSGIHCHGRVPEAVAHLQMGMDFFLLFLKEKQVMDKESCAEIQARFKDILYRLAARQAENIEQDKPTHVFIRKLFALIQSGQAVVRKRNRYEPGNSCPPNFIGYEDDNYYFLYKDAAHKAVRKLCEDQGEGFSISALALTKALAEEGLSVRDGSKNTKKLDLGDTAPRMIWLKKDRAQVVLDEVS